MNLIKWPKTDILHGINDNINVVARALRNAIILSDLAEGKKELYLIVKAGEEIAGDMEKLDKTVVSSVGKNLLKEIKDHQNAYNGVVKDARG